MSPRMLPFSWVIEQERRRWIPFRRMPSKEDQEAFDRSIMSRRHTQLWIIAYRR